MGLVLLDDSLSALNVRIREGDPTTGWRGDPTMMVYLEEEATPARAVVVGSDQRGNRYIAASTNLVNIFGDEEPGWRHTLLKKLREGDWQRADLVDRLMADMEAPHLAAERALDEANQERAERFGWALRRDIGHHYGGSTRSVL